MGLDFRTGSYRRRVKLGKRTVKDGEAIVIWDRNGVSREVIGPKLVTWIWFSTIRFLDHHVANERQYVVIEYRNGKVEHKRGPDVVWENPVKHKSVKVCDAVQLLTDADYVVILNQKDPSQKMRVERGPKLYFLKEHEVCHQLEWTEAINGSAPRPQTFQVIRTTNQTFEPSIPLARNTSVTFCVQYRIGNNDADDKDDATLVRLVSNFSDPTSVMLDALRSDVIALRSVESLVTDDRLANVSTQLPRLFGACAQMGITLENVRVLTFHGLQGTLPNTKDGQPANQDSAVALQAKKKVDRVQETIGFLKELKALDVNLTDVVCTALKSTSPESDKQLGALTTLAKQIALVFNTTERNGED